jgi:putative transposase
LQDKGCSISKLLGDLRHDVSVRDRKSFRARLRKGTRMTMVARTRMAGRGGARNGAGRKRLGERAYVPHLARGLQAGEYPVHVTARAVPGLPSFREHRIGSLMLLQLRRLNDATFQIAHHSVQSNHVHLIAEADDGETVSRKIGSFMCSFAKRLNVELGRRGEVWRERFFCRDIVDARDMHNVLAYVFGNAKKHGEIPREALELDPFSSAWTFDGWDRRVELPPERVRWQAPEARTELLRRDWIAYGLLRV